jgi:3-deoxy-D-manno-octulosonate 8-phosphate phosphatase KdsC-like HAD superfamily phosphatase
VTEIVGQTTEQPAVIEQLNLAFDIEQDRMLFKVGLSDNTELAIWMTRRIAKSISAWLQGSQAAVDASMQVLVMNAQGGLDEVGAKIMSACSITPEALMKTSTQNLDFSAQYQPNRKSRLAEPMLAIACKLLTDNATQFVLEFSAKDGINAQIAFNAELKIAFGNMLQLASKEAVWDIGVQASHFVPPAVTSSQVLH